MLETAAGQLIGNRYELQRELARGGMGSVWVAADRKLKRSVAVKVMVAMWAEMADATLRFEREAMAVAQLQSPHVVQIFDYGVEEGCPYIVMELLEGEDLRERLQRQERLDLETTAKIVVQTAKALSVAHAAGIIHRDLKPGNIFLARSRDEEIIKVLDFGVAKVEGKVDADPQNKEEKTKAGTLLGTPQYMSPEQARGMPNIDHRADLWSLAVIAYRALTGKLPFTGKSAADVIVKLCTQDPPVATTIAPDLPKEVDRFFRRALARDSAHRFDSAREMAVAFSRIAPATFPSLNMPSPMPYIAEAAEHRARTPSDLDWDDSWQAEVPSARVSNREMPSGRRDAAGNPSGPGSEQEELSARLAPPNLAAAGVVPYPLGLPDGSLADPNAPGSLNDIGLAATSSSTLASGLVDATAARQAPRKRRPVLLIGLLLAGVAAGVGAFVGRGVLTGEVGATTSPPVSPGAGEQPANTSPTTTDSQAPGPDTSSPGTDEPPEPGSSAEPTAEPTVTSGGRRPPVRPPSTGRPKSTASPSATPTAAPPTKTADPFSERI